MTLLVEGRGIWKPFFDTRHPFFPIIGWEENVSVIFGVFLIIVTLALSVNFWACIRARTSLDRALANPNALGELVPTLLSEDFLSRRGSNSGVAEPDFYAHLLETTYWAATTTYRKVQYMLGAVMLGLVWLECFALPAVYFEISVGLIFLMALIPMPQPATKSVMRDLLGLSLIMYDFNKQMPSECQKYAERGHLSHLYKAVTHLA